ncbi:FHA domain-containing protein [Streptomyces eurythermus]|uniref:FHA domain-containing protein n=1 Tax=Streptomyces eurythermus TaxID=42237 RepID=UPI0036D22F8E
MAGGVLRLVFRAGGGHLDVPRGGEPRLGRSGDRAPEASALLADEETVSARHATVERTAEGARGATNGTRVNHRVLVPGRAVRLRDGDRIEPGPRAGFEVRGVEEEPAADWAVPGGRAQSRPPPSAATADFAALMAPLLISSVVGASWVSKSLPL